MSPMSRRSRVRWFSPHVLFGLFVVLSFVAGAVSCSKSHRQQLFTENLLPTVTISDVVVDTSRTHPDTWRVTLRWVGNDADGTIERMEYALDPTFEDSVWVTTTANPLLLEFPVKARDASGAIVPEYHVIAMRVRDNRNERSPVVAQALYAGNVPPRAIIEQPTPSALLSASVPETFLVRWSGEDPDGFPTRLPAFYRVRTVLSGSQLFDEARAEPDRLIRDGELGGWDQWTRVGPDTAEFRLTGLANGQQGLFAVVAFDAQGANTVHASLSENVVRFTVSEVGPRIHFYSGTFDYMVGGGYPSQFGQLIPVEVPGFVPISVFWDVQPVPGSRIVSTRWVLDPVDVSDNTTRTDPSDMHHWSAPSSGSPAGVTVGPFLDAQQHSLYIDATDNLNRRSLTGARFFVVPPAFQKDLLIVDDTRREADKFAPNGCPNAYARPWPSASEIDTFLYARGGVPWRCLRNGAVANSGPGLFAGYSFDTTGTRRGLEDPARAVSLSTLSRYRHVLWLTDMDAALNSDALDPIVFPMTALRTMFQPGHQDVLTPYVALGGQLWLAGGGTAYATLVTFDSRLNNTPSAVVFDSQRAELKIGRLLYDYGHLRSAIAVARPSGVALSRSASARGGWSGHGVNGTLSAPDYSRLPPELRLRDPGTDPIPPTRLSSQASLYYPSTIDLEYVSAPNVITEDMDPDPAVVRIESTLDTLVDASGPGLLTSPAPAMTYYHGRDNAPFLFSGFNLWSWTRTDAQGLVDFVLGDIWGLARTGPRAAGVPASAGTGDVRRAGTRPAAQRRLDPLRARP